MGCSPLKQTEFAINARESEEFTRSRDGLYEYPSCRVVCKPSLKRSKETFTRWRFGLE